jgi:hypothetical protein
MISPAGIISFLAKSLVSHSSLRHGHERALKRSHEEDDDVSPATVLEEYDHGRLRDR